MSLCDHVIVLENGEIRIQGAPNPQIYEAVGDLHQFNNGSVED
jgi:ABC-type polysaccharide/polyol phosphate transport system ATPase subunit